MFKDLGGDNLSRKEMNSFSRPLRLFLYLEDAIVSSKVLYWDLSGVVSIYGCLVPLCFFMPWATAHVTKQRVLAVAEAKHKEQSINWAAVFPIQSPQVPWQGEVAWFMETCFFGVSVPLPSEAVSHVSMVE